MDAREVIDAQRCRREEFGTAERAGGQRQVYSVRLSAEEQDELRRVADAKHLPTSTLVRSWILERLDHERPA